MIVSSESYSMLEGFEIPCLTSLQKCFIDFHKDIIITV